MSQLVRAIVATDTGHRREVQDSFSPLFTDVFNRKELLEDTSDPVYIGKIYRIGVTLSAQAMVSDLNIINGSQDECALESAIERTKRSIIEAVYGEFREDFLRIESALYDRDFRKARSMLTEFQRKMYEIS